MPDPLRVIFFGRSTRYALTVLDEVRRRHQVVGIVESPSPGAAAHRPRIWLDRIRGHPSLELASRRTGIPYFCFRKGSDDALRAFILGRSPDAGAICSFARLIPTTVIELFPRGILNLHPSLLPNYRGPAPTFWEFWHSEPEGGVTIHFIDRGEDTGDIVAQARIQIPFGTDGDEHLGRCIETGTRLLNEALDALSAGTIQPRPQRHLSCPFRARYVRGGELPIDWAATPLEQVFHLLRGVLPFVDLLPPPPFPLRLLSFRAGSFERCAPRSPPGAYFIRRGKVTIAHAEGHLQLDAMVEPFRAVRVARDWILARTRA
jgi:methionyl-tRNA formyltransferase